MDKLTALNQTQIVGSIPEAVLTVRTYTTTAPYEPRFSVQIATQHRTRPRRRVHRTDCEYVLAWNEIRTNGPLLRFDPHPEPKGEHPDHGVWSGGSAPGAALAEAFQEGCVHQVRDYYVLNEDEPGGGALHDGCSLVGIDYRIARVAGQSSITDPCADRRILRRPPPPRRYHTISSLCERPVDP